MSTYFARTKLLLGLLMVLMMAAQAAAQSLIVGIPNAETTHKGHIAWTHESQVNWWAAQPAAWNSFNFLTYGAGKQLELAVSLNNIASPASGNVALGFGYKYMQPLFTKHARLQRWELKLTGGNMLFLSTERSSVRSENPETNPERWGGWVYGHGSTRLPHTHTRLTLGGSYGSSHAFGIGQAPLSLMAGIEQPLHKRLWLVADWYSGHHALAALIGAVQINLYKPKAAIITGYKIPNDYSTQREAVIFEVMLEL